MSLYLVIHTPKPEEESSTRPPTRLLDLARAHSGEGSRPRWLQAWSPDLHDDRIFSLWDATNAEEIRNTIEQFGFLDDMDAQPLQVRAWGPDDVIASHQEDD